MTVAANQGQAGALAPPSNVERRELITPLAYVETGSHKAAAHRLAISESTSRQRVSRTLDKIEAVAAAQADLVAGMGEEPQLRLPLDQIRVGKRYRKSLGDIQGLAASIATQGLLHPIMVSPDGEMIAGERRLAAVRALGWDTVPVTVLFPADLLRAESDENVVRQDFAPSEAAEIAALLRPIEQAEAKERMSQGGKGVQLGHPSKGRAQAKVAAAVGMKPTTLANAEAVVAAAQADPAMGDLVANMDATGKVDTAYRALTKRQVVAVIEAEPQPLPTGPFRVIVADPPRAYSNRAEDGSHRAANPYPSMSLDAIRAMPVAGIAHDDAVLWLWTTNAHMEHAFGVVRAWGFEPRTILTWAKDRMGTGDWLRGQTEHCLMAIRGAGGAAREVGADGQGPAVRAEGDFCERLVLSSAVDVRTGDRPIGHGPDHHGLVREGRGEQLAVRAEGQPVDPRRCLVQDGRRVAGGDVPQDDLSVLASGDQASAIRAVRDGHHTFGVTSKRRADRVAGGRAPQPDRRVVLPLSGTLVLLSALHVGIA